MGVGGHRQPLRREILHREAGRADGVVKAVDMKLGRPAPARGGAGNVDIREHGAAGRALEGVAFELDARRPLDQQIAGPVVDGDRRLVAHQGREMGAFARPIDAPVGVDIAVDGGLLIASGDQIAGRLGIAAADALLGQVGGRAFEVERGHVALGPIGHHHLRFAGAFAPQQGVVEGPVPRSVGAGGRQSLAIMGHQHQPQAGKHLGCFQRARDNVQRPRSTVGGQGHVGEDHPAAGLGRLAVAAALFVAAGLGRGAAGGVASLDDIAAGNHVLQHRAEGKHRGGLGGAVAAHRDQTLPDDPPLLVRAVLAIVAGVFVLAGGIGRADRAADEIAVRHPPHLDRQAGDIDRLDADAVGLLARQDHPLAGEADIGRLVAGGEVDVLVGRQGLARLGRQALEQGHPALVEPDAAQAQGVAGDADRRRVVGRRRDQHEVAIGLARIERPAHLDTGQRLGAAGVQPGFPDGEVRGFHGSGPGRVGRARLAEQRPAAALGHGDHG